MSGNKRKHDQTQPRGLKYYFPSSQSQHTSSHQNNYDNNNGAIKKRKTENRTAKQNISYEGLSQDAKLDMVLNKIDNFVTKTEEHDARISAIENDNYGRDYKLNELEQKMLNNQMEITGLKIPNDLTERRKQLKQYIFNFFSSINLSVDASEIISVKLFNRKMKQASQPIYVVEFLNEDIKYDVMKAKKNTPPIYFSHVLTRHNRFLLTDAKKLVRQNLIQFAWSSNGNIFIKRKDGKKERIFDFNQISDIGMVRNDTDSEYEDSMESTESMDVTVIHQGSGKSSHSSKESDNKLIQSNANAPNFANSKINMKQSTLTPKTSSIVVDNQHLNSQ